MGGSRDSGHTKTNLGTATGRAGLGFAFTWSLGRAHWYAAALWVVTSRGMEGMRRAGPQAARRQLVEPPRFHAMENRGHQARPPSPSIGVLFLCLWCEWAWH